MNSTNAATGRLSTEWFKLTAIIVTIFIVAWAIAIGYWRLTTHNPDTGDLALGLLGLPVCMLFAVWGAAKAMNTRAATVPASTPKPASQTSAADVAATPALAILGSALRSPHGASAQELAGAIADNGARAGLDKKLVDDNGFPVMTARSDDAQDDALQNEIAEWLTSQNIQVHFSDEQWRALVLASGVTAELAIQAAGDLMPTDGNPPLLQLRLMLPHDWTVEIQRAATMWLKHTVSQYGWPEAGIAVPPPSEQDSITTSAAILTRLMPEASSKHNQKQLAMVVACASLIGQDSVDQLAARSALFTSSQSRGQIPGEGAAGLLLTDLRQAQARGAEYVLLGPIKEARRDTSADDARRVDATLLLDLIEQIREPASVELNDIAMVVADTAHRPNRVLELMGLAAPAIPQVDAADDIVRIGLGSGSCGAVPFMTVLALARHYALERNAPILCIGNEDPFLRSVALVRLPA